MSTGAPAEACVASVTNPWTVPTPTRVSVRFRVWPSLTVMPVARARTQPPGTVRTSDHVGLGGGHVGEGEGAPGAGRGVPRGEEGPGVETEPDLRAFHWTPGRRREHDARDPPGVAELDVDGHRPGEPGVEVHLLLAPEALPADSDAQVAGQDPGERGDSRRVGDAAVREAEPEMLRADRGTGHCLVEAVGHGHPHGTEAGQVHVDRRHRGGQGEVHELAVAVRAWAVRRASPRGTSCGEGERAAVPGRRGQRGAARSAGELTVAPPTGTSFQRRIVPDTCAIGSRATLKVTSPPSRRICAGTERLTSRPLDASAEIVPAKTGRNSATPLAGVVFGAGFPKVDVVSTVTWAPGHRLARGVRHHDGDLADALENDRGRGGRAARDEDRRRPRSPLGALASTTWTPVFRGTVAKDPSSPVCVLPAVHGDGDSGHSGGGARPVHEAGDGPGLRQLQRRQEEVTSVDQGVAHGGRLELRRRVGGGGRVVTRGEAVLPVAAIRVGHEIEGAQTDGDPRPHRLPFAVL